MGRFLQTMKAGLGNWITWGMYACGAAMTGLAIAATAKGYYSADLWIGAGLLDSLALGFNYVSGSERLNVKQYQL